MNKFYSLVVVILTISLLGGCEQKKEQQPPLETINTVLEETEPPIAVEGTLKSSAGPTEPSTIDKEIGQTISATVTDSSSAHLSPAIYEKPTAEQIQQALKNAGLYQGEIDGKIGPKSKKAIGDFQEQHGLTVDGKVGPKTWEKLAPYLGQTPTAVPVEETVSSESTY